MSNWLLLVETGENAKGFIGIIFGYSSILFGLY